MTMTIDAESYNASISWQCLAAASVLPSTLESAAGDADAYDAQLQLQWYIAEQ